MIEPEVCTYITSVSLKLSPFWRADLQFWFTQVEVKFVIRGENCIATSLLPFYQVWHWGTWFDFKAFHRNPLQQTEGTTHKIHGCLRAKKIATTVQFWWVQLQLMQLLQRMQQLPGNTPGISNRSFICKLFLQQLPTNIRMVLASTSDSVSFNNLTQLADKIVKVTAPLPISTVLPSNLSDKVE